MEIASLFQLLATLSVTPDRSQFFRYDRVELSCVANSSGWTVKRTTQRNVDQPCGNSWSVPNGSVCTIKYAYPADTGVYWCESQHGGRSNRVNLTVTGGSVILEMPALGVTEGDDAVLRCSAKDGVLPNASFYKDRLFIGTEPSGALVIRGVTAADQDSYTCKDQNGRVSLQSTLLVRERPRPSPPPLSAGSSRVPWTRVICGVLLVLFYLVLLVLLIYTCIQWSGAKADFKTATQ